MNSSGHEHEAAFGVDSREGVKPLVSVVMAVFNGEPHLSSAIESILHQTFTDFELLVIDDGSTDATPSVLGAYAMRDRRVRVLRNEANRGRSFSARRGVQESAGSLIARLDADDWAYPERLQQQVAYLQAHPDVAVLGSWAIDVNEQGVEQSTRRVPTQPTLVRRLIWTNPIINSSVMFRKDAIVDLGSYDASLEYLEDYQLWFRCAEAGLVLANLPEPLIRYRNSPAQHRKRKRTKWRLAQFRVGWGGCMRLGLGPIAYLGVAAPVIKSLFPHRYATIVNRCFRRFDPRNSAQ